MYPEIVMMAAAAAIAALGTRVITRDVIAAPVRRAAAWIDTRRGIPDLDDTTDTPAVQRIRVAGFVACPRCVGWWIALAAHLAVYLAWPAHTWALDQIIVWIASAAATNIAYCGVAAAAEAAAGVVEDARHLASAAEMRLHDHRRVSM